MRWEGSENDASGADDRLFSDFNSGSDKGLGCDPGSSTENNGFRDEIESGESMIVGSGAEKGALGNAAVGFNRDRSEVEQECFFPDPDMISDNETPRHPDVDLRANDESFSDPCSKKSEQHGTECGGERKGGQEEETFDKHPKRFFPARDATFKLLGRKPAEVHGRSVIRRGEFGEQEV